MTGRGSCSFRPEVTGDERVSTVLCRTMVIVHTDLRGRVTSADYFPFLCLDFLLSKMGTIIAPLPQDGSKDSMSSYM